MALYHVGEYIVYGSIGVCRVEAIGPLSFLDSAPKEYYTLRPLYTTGNDTIYTPVDTTVSMRRVLTPAEVEAQLEALHSTDVELCITRNQAFLAEHYQQRIRPHNVTALMQVFKEIFQKEKALKRTGKKLNRTDNYFYHLVAQQLSEEFALVLNESPADAQKRLLAAAA